LDVSSFDRPVFKNRLSSHGNGVTWNIHETTSPRQDWLVQESLDIYEELRVYVINGKVYPIGAVRQSKILDQNTQAIDSRPLETDEIDFSSRIGQQVPFMDIIGLDIARNSDGKLYLMEVNRSPGFGNFAMLTGVNLASFLYGEKF
jgi:glutathione synthase/RimK-type ligase-like ATP-grasp enzyme